MIVQNIRISMPKYKISQIFCVFTKHSRITRNFSKYFAKQLDTFKKRNKSKLDNYANI